MPVLLFFHVVFVVLWLGSAAGEIVLELMLWRTPSGPRQRAYIDLHRVIDLVLEGPALVLTLVTGAALMWREGYFFGEGPRLWPAWLEDKLLAIICLVVANGICFVFVQLRARAADQLRASETPLADSRVQLWHYAVSATFIGVPFALIALWLAVNKGTA